MADEIKTSSNSSRKKVLYLILSAALTLGVFYFLFQEISLEQVSSTLKNADPYWIGLFFVGSITMSFARAYRYQYMLRLSGEQTGLLGLFFITLVRNLFSDLLPARLGTLSYVVLARSRLNISLSAASSSFAFSLLFDVAVMAPLLLIVLTASIIELPMQALVISAAVLFAVSAGLIILAPWLSSLCLKLLEALPGVPGGSAIKFKSYLEAMRDDFLKFRSPVSLLKLFAITAVIRISKYLSLSAFLFALLSPLGHTAAELGIVKAFAGIASAELAASLPISGIAGFGIYEGTWALVFSAIGLSKQTAVLTAIAHHLFTQVYGWIMGLIGALALLLFLPKSNLEKS